MMIKSGIRSLLFAAAALVAFGPLAPEAKTLDEILTAKKIAVGINPALPPLGLYNDKNEIDGFDAEFAKRSARCWASKSNW
jgi:polar amino acid transport system substrate-binding protein